MSPPNVRVIVEDSGFTSVTVSMSRGTFTASSHGVSTAFVPCTELVAGMSSLTSAAPTLSEALAFSEDNDQRQQRTVRLVNNEKHTVAIAAHSRAPMHLCVEPSAFYLPANAQKLVTVTYRPYNNATDRWRSHTNLAGTSLLFCAASAHDYSNDVHSDAAQFIRDVEQANANDVLKLPLEVCMYVRLRARDNGSASIMLRDKNKASLSKSHTANSMHVEDVLNYTSSTPSTTTEKTKVVTAGTDQIASPTTAHVSGTAISTTAGAQIESYGVQTVTSDGVEAKENNSSATMSDVDMTENALHARSSQVVERPYDTSDASLPLESAQRTNVQGLPIHTTPPRRLEPPSLEERAQWAMENKFPLPKNIKRCSIRAYVIRRRQASYLYHLRKKFERGLLTSGGTGGGGKSKRRNKSHAGGLVKQRTLLTRLRATIVDHIRMNICPVKQIEHEIARMKALDTQEFVSNSDDVK